MHLTNGKPQQKTSSSSVKHGMQL